MKYLKPSFRVAMLGVAVLTCAGGMLRALDLPGLGPVEGVWCWHPQQGWIFARPDGDSMWYYRADLGWIWTSDAGYPVHYHARSGHWLTYEASSARLQRWYDNSEQRWRFSVGPDATALERRLPALIETSREHLLELLASNPETAEFPYKTDANGNWVWSDSNSWISGYLPAEVLRLYSLTGDTELLDQAKIRLARIESQKTNASHDMWFKVGLPFSLAYELTGEAAFRDVVIQAANTYESLFSPTVGSVRCWDFGYYTQGNNFTVVVDDLTDLHILPYASILEGGKAEWVGLAKTIGSTHWRDHVRADGSTRHILIYDETNGSISEVNKGQGWAPESTWTRGQAWAILGYAQLYADTGDADYLDWAERVLDNYLSRAPAGTMPPWDFDAPETFYGFPPDSSAAIVVAKALWLLKKEAATAEARRRYATDWEAMLEMLTAPPYFNADEPSNALLLHGSHFVTNGPGSYDQATAWGDFYFMDVLVAWAEELMLKVE